MSKLKTFFDKFKGYILTIALAILTAIEFFGGYIDGFCNGAFTINGVEILPIVTLICTVIVGLISNGFTKEQSEKIKALLTSLKTTDSNTKNELVIAEIKKTIKSNNEELNFTNKEIIAKENALKTLENDLVAANATLTAKKQMHDMTPQLATDDDVINARAKVDEIEKLIADKKAEIDSLKVKVSSLETQIVALKNQL